MESVGCIHIYMCVYLCITEEEKTTNLGENWGDMGRVGMETGRGRYYVNTESMY